MELESISSIGTEEWVCPDCERRLVQYVWHPDAREVVVNPGDETVLHRRSNTLSDEQANARRTQLTAEEVQRLRPWAEWLEQLDFDRGEDDSPPEC
jgi:hypothetical protein